MLSWRDPRPIARSWRLWTTLLPGRVRPDAMFAGVLLVIATAKTRW